MSRSLMNIFASSSNRLLLVIVLLILIPTTPILANQPQNAGDKNEKTEKNDQQNELNLSIAETIQLINGILSQYPAQEGDHYLQTTHISLKSRGKLLFITEYKLGTPCIAS